MKFRSTQTFKTTSLAVLGFMSASANLMAQDTVTKSSALSKYLTDGGALTIFIVAIGLTSLIGLSVYNFINLGKAKFCPDDLKAAMLDHMQNCRVRSAIELAASHPSYLGRMLAYSLPNVDATQPETLGRDGVEDAIADFTVNENRKQMLWINLISLVAQSAPMLGLFGTVFGMIAAFATLKEAGAEPSKLAGDISVALLTTMWGLVVAILSVVAYFFFKSRYNNLVAECHATAEELIDASLQTVNGDGRLAKIPEGIAV